MRYHVFYNPNSGSAKTMDIMGEIKKIFDGEMIEHDVLDPVDKNEIIAAIPDEDILIVAGGDGTLNHMVNEVDCEKIANELYYFATGTGNDFLRDMNVAEGIRHVKINDYVKNLPTVKVNGKTYKFINGVGFGIDGYCCEVGDEMRAKSDKPVNYAGIAVKGVLFKYKACGATVTVDGETKTYKKAWLAPTMYGKYYGGGMIPHSRQERNNPDGTVSLMVMHDSARIPTLIAFPGIFKGKLENKKKIVDVFVGHEIKVVFAEPRALQIDGETITGVKEYTVRYN